LELALFFEIKSFLFAEENKKQYLEIHLIPSIIYNMAQSFCMILCKMYLIKKESMAIGSGY